MYGSIKVCHYTITEINYYQRHLTHTVSRCQEHQHRTQLASTLRMGRYVIRSDRKETNSVRYGTDDFRTDNNKTNIYVTPLVQTITPSELAIANSSGF
jgi:hypothetical protein